jgi:glycerol-3-phosphate acyltransferase PlsY
MGILDMLKVAIPMIYFKYVLYPNHLYHLVLSIAGLVGHIWPLYSRFKGGRGFSVMVSSFFVVDWLGTVIVLGLGLLLGMVVVQNLMVAYVGWLWLMVPWLFLRTFDVTYLLYVLGLISIFLITTIPEIRAFVQLNREGKGADFFERGLYSSSPRWRGMQRMQERLNALGPWRFVLAALAVLIVTFTFAKLPPI